MNCPRYPAASIIIPVHNRKQTTLTCLEHLQQQGELDKYAVVVVDDGSTDGTADAIAHQFPQVKVLQGDGNLWWTGAICRGMEYALAQGAEYLVWLNDDCLPEAGSIATLLEQCNANPNLIAGAQSLDPGTRKPSYGGILRRGPRITHIHSAPNAASDSWPECDGLSGNFVCLPKSVVERVGYPDPGQCPHYYGDVVYTHHAKRKGYKLLIVGGASALCKDDHVPESWLTTQRSLVDVWKERFQVKSPHYWKAHLGFYQEIFGLSGIGIYIYELWVKFFIISILVLLIPYHYRLRLKQFVSKS